MQVLRRRFDEVKVVYPAVDPAPYSDPSQYLHRYLQPMDCLDPDEAANNKTDCIDYVLAHPEWVLSLQTHKMVGLP